MRPLPDDIVEFIHQHFATSEIPSVYELLDRHELSTPRVHRALLYLSGGSLTMLRHYVASAALDIREILLRAEYVLNVGSEPMRVRSMAEPFDGPHNHVEPVLAADAPTGLPARRPSAVVVAAAAQKSSGRKAPARQNKASTRDAKPGHHDYLVGQRFVLGQAEYVVSAEQTHRTCVRCYRKSGNVVTIVHLPLVFVMEQLSEHIDLDGAVN